ncbi:MAG: holo-ACP synthase [Patulibacter sp.]
MTVLGLGIDVVDIAAFGEQLADPASGFVAGTFTAAECAAAAAGAGADATHLAARFAVKEAFVKAWSSARIGQQPALATPMLDLRDIELGADAHGRPVLYLHGAVREAVASLLDSAPTPANLLVSLSHDGPVATAVVLLQRRLTVAPAPAADAPIPAPEETTP